MGSLFPFPLLVKAESHVITKLKKLVYQEIIVHKAFTKFKELAYQEIIVHKAFPAISTKMQLQNICVAADAVRWLCFHSIVIYKQILFLNPVEFYSNETVTQAQDLAFL